jgi:hypothetical protein
MTEQDTPKPVPETFSARLIRREAERRAAMELATTTPAGLESALARLSAEVTAEAAEARAMPAAAKAPAAPLIPPG